MLYVLIGGGVALVLLGIALSALWRRTFRPSYKADAARLARRDSDRQHDEAGENLAAAELAAGARVGAIDDVDSAIEFMRDFTAGKASSED